MLSITRIIVTLLFLYYIFLLLHNYYIFYIIYYFFCYCCALSIHFYASFFSLVKLSFYTKLSASYHCIIIIIDIIIIFLSFLSLSHSRRCTFFRCDFANRDIELADWKLHFTVERSTRSDCHVLLRPPYIRPSHLWRARHTSRKVPANCFSRLALIKSSDV